MKLISRTATFNSPKLSIPFLTVWAISALVLSPKALCADELPSPDVALVVSRSQEFEAFKLNMELALNKDEDVVTKYCSKFVNAEGITGPWGLVVKNYILEDDQLSKAGSIFFTSNQSQACPKWKTLTKAQKLNFWVWTLGAISFQESTCREKLYYKTRAYVSATRSYKTFVCAGLTQMPYIEKERSWRGSNCRGSGELYLSAKPNIRCALDILADTLDPRSQYNGNGKIYGPNASSYWEELRKEDGGKIGKNIRLFKDCN